MSKLKNPHKATSTDTTTNDSDSTEGGENAFRAVYESYGLLDQYHSLIETVLVASSEDEDIEDGENHAFGEDHPMVRLQSVIKDYRYGDDEQDIDAIGELVGAGPLTYGESKSEYGDGDRITEFEELDVEWLSEADETWHNFLVEEVEWFESDYDYPLPVVDGATMPVSIYDGEEDKLNEALQSLAVVYNQGTDVEKPTASDDGGSSGVAKPSASSSSSSSEDVTDKNAVLAVWKDDEKLAQRARESAHSYRGDTQEAVEDRFGKTVTKDNISQIASDFRDGETVENVEETTGAKQEAAEDNEAVEDRLDRLEAMVETLVEDQQA